MQVFLIFSWILSGLIALPGDAPFRRGDVNQDGGVLVSDCICCLDYLFRNSGTGCSLKIPSCPDAADTNDDGEVDISDAILIVFFLFAGSSIPPPLDCGPDPVGDQLPCNTYPPCERPAGSYRLVFSTLLGGSGGENFRDVAVDSQGNIYVTGGTSSPDFPTTPGVHDRSFGQGGADLGDAGPMDIFVTKFSPEGQLIWSTYVGGPNYDRAYAIEVDGEGDVYLAGRAGPGFPATAGALQEAFAGDSGAGFYGKQDGFMAKLASDGSRLIWATYFGESDGGIIRDLDIDASGNVYIISPGNTVPNHRHITAGSYDTTHNGDSDLVIAKISADGSRVIWGTFLGGSGNDGGGPSVRVDRSTGAVCAVGNTSSANFPTPKGYDTSYGGGAIATGDAFLARLSADGSTLEFGTFLGGSSDEGTGTHNLILDRQGNIFVGHWTKSSGIPILPGGFQNSNGGGVDCILWKFSPSGNLLANTYLGGNGDENIQGMATDSEGNVYVSVDATSSTNLPVTPDAFQPANHGNNDGAYVKLSPHLSQVLYSTYLGGGGHDGSREAALAPDGSYICAGDTASDDFPLEKAFDSTRNGNSDGFVAKFSPAGDS